MNTIEAERLNRQASRVRQLSDELETMSITITGAESNTGDAPNIGEKQTRLQDELEQLISDAHHMLEHSDGLQNERSYEHPRDSFTVEENSDGDYVITYTGGLDLDAGVTTVYVDGAEYSSQFSGTITTNDTMTVPSTDVSSMVEVEWDTDLSHNVKWEFPNGTRVPIDDMSNLPETSYHDPQTFNTTFRV